MEAVVKVGGSLAKNQASLTELCQELSSLSKVHKILVVPGGGDFAVAVRKFDRIHSLSNTASHKMAILAMDQYGIFLSDITPDSCICYSLKEAGNQAAGALPIFLPSKLMFRKDPLEHSWDVTSDTIAAYIASSLHAKKLILVTDVDGIFIRDPKQKLSGQLIEDLSAKELFNWNKTTSVDKTLPKILQNAKIDCYVINGGYPKRIKQILKNEKTVCTHITV